MLGGDSIYWVDMSYDPVFEEVIVWCILFIYLAPIWSWSEAWLMQIHQKWLFPHQGHGGNTDLQGEIDFKRGVENVDKMVTKNKRGGG